MKLACCFLVSVAFLNCKPDDPVGAKALKSKIESAPITLSLDSTTHYSCEYTQRNMRFCDEFSNLTAETLGWAEEECKLQSGTFTPSAICPLENRQSSCEHRLAADRPINLTSYFYRNDQDPEITMECTNK